MFKKMCSMRKSRWIYAPTGREGRAAAQTVRAELPRIRENCVNGGGRGALPVSGRAERLLGHGNCANGMECSVLDFSCHR